MKEFDFPFFRAFFGICNPTAAVQNTPMIYTQFGNTGMSVSRYCLGAMTFGNELPKEQVSRVIDEAIERGVNFIDTAESYGPSEAVLGELLGTKRDKIFLATKAYEKYSHDGRVGRNSRINLLTSIDRSLRALRTDHVDLYQLHHPDPETPVDETMETLDHLVKTGKIRYAGVSNHYAWQMTYMNAQAALRGRSSSSARSSTSR
jgi:1-deoxyxylulose-5-phosphate synthase